MSRYLPRRLRKTRRPEPKPMIVLRYTGPGNLSPEMADTLKRKWKAAQRDGITCHDRNWQVYNPAVTPDPAPVPALPPPPPRSTREVLEVAAVVAIVLIMGLWLAALVVLS